MGQLLAPPAFGSKTCVVRAFVVTPDTHSFIYAFIHVFLFGGEASREPRVLLETSLKMRGMSPFLFVKLVQQRRTQNHAKPAHRVRRSSGQPFTGTTRSAGVAGVGLASAILVGLAKNTVAILVGLAKKWCCAVFLYISAPPFLTI